MSQQTTPRPDLKDPGMPESGPRHRRLWVWILLGISVPLLAGAITWYAPATHPAATTHTVIYSAEGDGARGIRTAFITLQAPTGGQQAETNLPLKTANGSTGLTFPGFKTGDFVYLSVQNKDSAGSVTCRITVDGYTVSENTSVGGYTIATCKGQVPK